MPATPSTLALALQEILEVESLDTAAAPTFFDLLDRLHTAKYTGQVVLHFDAGVPRVVEFSQPTQIRLSR